MSIVKLATERYYEQFDGVSDIDYGFNPDTQKWDVPSVEWDTPYGRFWKRYESEEARTADLNAHTERMDKWVAEEVARIKESRRTPDNSFGAAFPQLAALAS